MRLLRARPGEEAGPVEAFRIDRVVTLEHPSGTFDAAVTITTRPGATPRVESAGIVRTARKLFDGAVFPRPR